MNFTRPVLSWQSWWRLLALGLVFWLVITHIDLIDETFWVLYSAFLLALLIHPLANLFHRRRIPRAVAVLLVYALALGALVILSVLLQPMLVMEFTQLQTQGPMLLNKLLQRFGGVPWIANWAPSLDSLIQSQIQRIDAWLLPLASALTSLGNLTVDIFVVLVLAFFFASDGSLGQRILANWVPEPYQNDVSIILNRLVHRLTHLVWAQVAVALYLAVTFSMVFSLLGIPFALSIGVISGVLELIPYLGGAVGILLAVLSALTVNPWLAVWAVLAHIIIMEIESHIIAPMFYGRLMGLHPALILFALFVGAKAKGILGVLFAVPITVTLVVILQEIRDIRQSPPCGKTPSPPPHNEPEPSAAAGSQANGG